jgi:peptidoglycan/xylan/chitin deacetylase (PgdA/CDA1 family)
MADPTTPSQSPAPEPASAGVRVSAPAQPLRVRLSGPSHLHEQAAWALEALLARARVREWEIVAAGEEGADLEWGDGGGGSGPRAGVALPADPAAWEFAWDREPDPARDPLAFTFWWLARVEEQLAPEHAFDGHGRFRAAGSALARREDPLAAPVDELARELAAGLSRWATVVDPGGPTWRLVATHDIDLPWRWTSQGRRRALRRMRDELRAGRIAGAARTAVALAGSPLAAVVGDPWDNLAAITRLERREQARSTSFLLVGRHVDEDGSAQLHERGAGWARTGSGIDELGDLVGLHGSYTSSVVEGRLRDERVELQQRLGVPVADHRFHYLRHRPDAAWPLLERVGIETDSSLGYAERPGFRAGTAQPFRAWDHGRGRPLGLVVIPLAVMDASYDERYLHLNGAACTRHLGGVVERIRELDGAACLLVHNDRLCTVDDGGWTRRYRAILRMVRDSGGVACTAAAAGAAYRELLPAWRTPARPDRADRADRTGPDSPA